MEHSPLHAPLRADIYVDLNNITPDILEDVELKVNLYDGYTYEMAQVGVGVAGGVGS